MQETIHLQFKAPFARLIFFWHVSCGKCFLTVYKFFDKFILDNTFLPKISRLHGHAKKNIWHMKYVEAGNLVV